MDIFIYKDLSSRITCPICKDTGHFEVESTFESNSCRGDGSLLCESCGASFAIREGILNLTTNASPELSYWNKLYDKGVKGNPIRSAEELTRFLATGLDDPTSLQAYYPLIGLVNNLGIRFQDSIEIGCGTGSYSLLLKRLNLVDNPVLMDTSVSALKISQRLFENFGEAACLVLANGLRLPFADKSFDISLSGGLIEHFRDEEQTRIVSEHCRVAKRVVCQAPTPSPSYWLQRGIITLLNGRWPFGYERPISSKQVRILFQNSDFEIYSKAYHDALTVLLFRLSRKLTSLKPVKRKTILNWLVKTEIAALFVSKNDPCVPK